MAEHDPAFRNPQRHGVEDVRRAVEKAIAFLLLSAYDHFHVGVIDARRRVSHAQLYAAHLRPGSPTTLIAFVAESLLKCGCQLAERRLGKREVVRLRRRLVLALEAERPRQPM